MSDDNDNEIELSPGFFDLNNPKNNDDFCAEHNRGMTVLADVGSKVEFHREQCERIDLIDIVEDFFCTLFAEA